MANPGQLPDKWTKASLNARINHDNGAELFWPLHPHLGHDRVASTADFFLIQ